MLWKILLFIFINLCWSKFLFNYISYLSYLILNKTKILKSIYTLHTNILIHRISYQQKLQHTQYLH